MEKSRSLYELKQFLKDRYQAHDQIERLFYPEYPLPLADCYLDLGLIEEKVLREAKDKNGPEDSVDKIEKDLSAREHFLHDYERIQHIQRKLAVQAILQECKAPKKRVYIEGAAGAGKSTLSRFIANEWASNKAPWNEYEWVFFIRLRDLDLIKHPADKALLSVVDNELFEGHGNRLNHFELQQLNTALIENKDKVLWILDGYDELNLDIARCNWWRDLITSGFSLLITSRPGAQLPKNDLAINLNLAVLGFSDEQVQKYVTNFFDAKFTPDSQLEDAAKCLALLKSNLNLWSLAHTPIQLELLCSSWKEFAAQPDLPLTQLYRVILERLLKRRAVNEGLLLEESDLKVLHTRYADHLAYMEYLAFLGMQSQQIVLTEQHINQAYKILSPEKHKQATFYKELKALGLVKRYNNGKHAEFIHLTFQEFFAARYVAKAIKAFSQDKPHSLSSDNLLDFIAKTKWNPFYEVMWWFVAGLLGGNPNAQQQTMETYELKGGDSNQAQELTIPKTHQRLQTLQTFFDLLLQEPRAELEAFELPLLAKCYAEAGAPNIMQKEAVRLHFQAWLRFYWTSKYEDELQASALQKLVQVAKTSALLRKWIETICLSLLKNSSAVFIRAIKSLNPVASLPLQQGLLTLLKDQEENVCYGAANAVGALGPAVMQDLQHGLLALLKDQDKNLYAVVARAVGVLGPAASEVLQQSLLALLKLKDQDKKLRYEALSAIQNLGPAASAGLQQGLLALLNDEDQGVRLVAAHAVAALGPTATQALQQGLWELLKDQDAHYVIARAVGALGPAASPALQQGLLVILQDDNEWVREAAAKAVGALGPVASEVLQQGLLILFNDQSKYVRKAVACAVGALGPAASPSLQQGLLMLLKDQDEYVREKVACAVGALGPTATQALQQGLLLLLKDQVDDVRYEAARAIGALGSATTQALQQDLLALFNAQERWLRVMAGRVVRALGSAATQALRQGLLSLLSDEEWQVRVAAAEAVGALGPAATQVLQQGLLSLLSDEEWRVRAAAAEAVGALGPAASADLQQGLLVVLNDQGINWVAARAVEALGPAASADLQQGLLVLLENQNEFVRKVAIKALFKMPTGLVDVCQTIFKDQPTYIPPSRLILSAKDTVQVSHLGKLQCLKLCGTVLQNMVQDGSSHNLSHEHWTIAMVRKKPTPSAHKKSSSSLFTSLKHLTSHAFLLVEGVKDGVRFAQKIDLYALGTVNNSQSRGQKITIEITNITDFSRLQQLAENSYCMVQGISKEKVETLMQLIEEDRAKAERKEIIYNQTGDGSAALGQAKQHSCVSWCLEKWQQLELPLKRKWYDSIVVVASAYLPNPNKKDCLVM